MSSELYQKDASLYYGAKLLVKMNTINRAKETIFDKLIPEDGIKFEIEDKVLVGIMDAKLTNMNGSINISKENVRLKSCEKKLIINAENIKVIMNVTCQIGILSKTISVESFIGFFVELQFGQNYKNQLVIDDLQIQDFHFIDTFGNLNAPFKDIMNYLASSAKDKIKQQIEGMSTQLMVMINERLPAMNPDIQVEDTQINIDTSFIFSSVEDDVLVAYGCFYAYDITKEKKRPPFINDIQFPKENLNREITIYISEFTLNSFLYTYFSSEEIQRIPINKPKMIFSILSLIVGDLSDVNFFAQLINNTPIIITIEPNYIDVYIEPTIHLIQQKNNPELKEETLVKLKAKLNFKLSAHLINNNSSVKLTVKEYFFEDIQNIDRPNETCYLTSFVLNQIVPLIFNSEKVLAFQIPIDNDFFQLENAKLQFIKNHIKIQGDPVFI